MELTSSRGWESEATKLFMRGTVLVSDLLIFIPAVYFFVTSFYTRRSWPKKVS